jgi:hypothetical protein
MVSVDKLPMALEMLPKTSCNTTKCEIARFIRLGTDHTIDFTSIYVPRAKSDMVYQDDLYPPIFVHNPDNTPLEWFQGKISIPSVPFSLDISKEIQTEAASINSLDNTKLLPIQRTQTKLSNSEHLNQSLKTQRNATSKEPTKRATTRTSALPQNLTNNSSNEQAISSGRIISSNNGCSLDFADDIKQKVGFLEIESKGWFFSKWVPVYVTLNEHKMYIGPDELSFTETINYSLIKSLNEIDNGEMFMIIFDIKNVIIALRAPNKEERNNWFKILQYHVKNAPQISETFQHKNSNQVVPAASVLKSNIEVSSRNGAIIMTPLSFLASGKSPMVPPLSFLAGGKSLDIWNERLALLDSEGMIHLYRNDFKDYSNGLPPLEVIDIKNSLAIRNGPGMDGKTFHITKTAHSLHFLTRNISLADDWVPVR